MYEDHHEYAVIPPVFTSSRPRNAIVIVNTNEQRQGGAGSTYPLSWRVVAEFDYFGEAIEYAKEKNEKQEELHEQRDEETH